MMFMLLLIGTSVGVLMLMMGVLMGMSVGGVTVGLVLETTAWREAKRGQFIPPEGTFHFPVDSKAVLF